MKNKLLIVLILVILSGCAAYDKSRVDNAIDDALETPIAFPNNDKYYFSYYVPSNVGKLQTTQLSTLFVKDGTNIVMNFDTSMVIIDEYYSNEKNNEENVETYVDIAYSYEGEYVGHYGDNLTYMIDVVSTDSDMYFVHAQFGYVSFYSTCREAQLDSILHSIVVIGKSIKFNKELILSDFSLKSSLDIKEDEFDFAKDHIPESGMLSDLTKE